VKNIIATLDPTNPYVFNKKRSWNIYSTKLAVVVRNYRRTSQAVEADRIETVVPKEHVRKIVWDFFYCRNLTFYILTCFYLWTNREAIILYTLKVMDELLCKAKEVNPELTLEVIFADSLDALHGTEQLVASLKEQGKLKGFFFTKTS